MFQKMIGIMCVAFSVFFLTAFECNYVENIACTAILLDGIVMTLLSEKF